MRLSFPTMPQSLGCVLYCMMMLEGPYDMIFQKGDSVALAVQNPLTIPQSCRFVLKTPTLFPSVKICTLRRPCFVSVSLSIHSKIAKCNGKVLWVFFEFFFFFLLCLVDSYSQALQILLSSIMVSNPQERPNISWVLDQVQDLQSHSPNTQTNMV